MLSRASKKALLGPNPPRTEGNQELPKRPFWTKGPDDGFDDAKCRLDRDLTQTLVLLGRCHDTLAFRSAYELDCAKRTKVNLLGDGIDHGSCRVNTSTHRRQTNRHACLVRTDRS